MTAKGKRLRPRGFSTPAAMVAMAASAWLAVTASPAQASADMGCRSGWTLYETQFGSCSGRALLSPGNDSRVNLAMLLGDRFGPLGVAIRPFYVEPMERSPAGGFDWPSFLATVATMPPDPAENMTAVRSADDDLVGTRCQSNASGRAAFIAAVRAAGGVNAADSATLIAAREALVPTCTDEPAPPVAPIAVAAGEAQRFADYLRGARAFYDGDWGAAERSFAGVGATSNGWLAEAAGYMRARTALNAAVTNAYDEWGSPDWTKVTPAQQATVDQAFAAYLTAHPGGRYSGSAKALLRRVDWVAGRNEALLGRYAQVFADGRDPGGASLAALIEEFDSKGAPVLTPANAPTPLLLAIADLKAMRRLDPDAELGTPPPISRAALEAQAARFRGAEPLFAYLRAAHALYVERAPQRVAALIPASADGRGHLGFSRKLLRAMAAEAGNAADARAQWVAAIDAGATPYQRGSAELGLALHEERRGDIARVFAAGSPVRDPGVRAQLIAYSAGPALLEAIAADNRANGEERALARGVWLYKSLFAGRYGELAAKIDRYAAPWPVRDNRSPHYTPLAIDPEAFAWTGTRAGSAGYDCPSLKQVAATLASRPRDPAALLCLGEFLRLTGGDSSWGPRGLITERPEPDELGGAGDHWARPAAPTWFSRLAAYRRIIADPVSPADARAYALYRAFHCYAPSGNNTCDASEDPLAQRRAWFNELKRQYPQTRWARAAAVYW